MSFTFSFGNKTDVGMVREGNEDYMASFKTDAGHVFIVCDGMGGHASGEVASRLAVDTIRHYLETNADKHCRIDEVLSDALHQANNTIMQKAIDSPEYQGMGTTCVILLIKHGQAYLANVGDSRIYIIRNKKIYQLTKDQSFVQTLIDNGYLSYKDAESHPRKNELIQALGVTKVLQPDVSVTPLNIYKEDTFLLCSDGLSGMLNDDEIIEASIIPDPISASNALVELANKKGGVDNITVQIVKILKGNAIPSDELGKAPYGAILKEESDIVSKDVAASGIVETVDQSKNSGKVFPLLLILLGVILFSGFLYFLFFWNDNTNVNQIDDVNDGKIITKDFGAEKDNRMTQFFSELYRGTRTNQKPSDSGLVRIDSVKYVDMKGNTSVKNLKKLSDDIKTFGLEFETYSRDTLTVKDKDLNTRKYLIKTETSNDTIKVTEIIFVISAKKDSVKTTTHQAVDTLKSTQHQAVDKLKSNEREKIDTAKSKPQKTSDTLNKK